MPAKILIVDDSPVTRQLLVRLLKTSRYTFAEAETGDDALRLVREFKPDLILLDVVMPGLDGYQVCERIKADPDTREIPVIFLSALSEAADKVKGLEVGGVDYITKPFDRGEVTARIETQLKIRRLTRELMAANAELTKNQRFLDEDLKAAAVIQQSLLPHKPPEMKNLAADWKFMPSERIGGDIFNVLSLDEDHLGFYMIDISGHGVPPALVTFSVFQALQPQMGYTVRKRPGLTPDYEIASPSEVLRALDAEYPWERFERYLTVIYLIIDLCDGSLIYSSAGHPPPILLRAGGGMQLLEKGGTIIGLKGILPFEEEQLLLHENDKILLYTDGIFEVVNEEGEMLGQEQFHALVQSLRDLPIDAMLDAIVAAIKAFACGGPLRDDISLMGIEFKERKIKY